MAGEDERERRSDVLGTYIRAQRQLADLSLRQLADLSNVSNAYLSQVERGLHQPSVKILRSIAKALNLSAETLLSEAGLIAPEGNGGGPRADVEAAILSDGDLSDEEKQVLLGVYRNFRHHRE